MPGLLQWTNPKWPMTRTMPLYEAYTVVEHQRDLLKSYVWRMGLLSPDEKSRIRGEIDRMTLWLNEHRSELTFNMETHDTI